MSNQSVFKHDANEMASRLPDSHFTNDNIDLALSDLSHLLSNQQYDRDAIERGLKSLFECKHLSSPMVILSNIRQWAIEGLNDKDLRSNLERRNKIWCVETTFNSPNGQQNMTTKSRSVTAKQARNILANAFLGNCNDVMASNKDSWNRGGLDFREMLISAVGGRKIGLHKLQCLLVYFDICGSLEGGENRVISFNLIQFTPLSADSLSQTTEYVGDEIHLHTGTMECNPRKYHAFVNFANANYGYGRFIPSCTQEEILLMCCPELTVGMLFLGKMGENQVVNVSGIKRFCRYSGYLDSFRCEGPMTSESFTVLTLDACYERHFSEAMLWRDVGKSYYSFLALANDNDAGTRPVVSTGKWGCGMFGGTASHKLLQQAVAASAAGVDLDFSVLGSYEGCDEIVKTLFRVRPSVPKVVSLIQCCKNSRTFVSDAVEFLQTPESTVLEAGSYCSDAFGVV